MPARYAPLPASATNDPEDEMEAAFDDSDSESEETEPLQPHSNRSYQPLNTTPQQHTLSFSQAPPQEGASYDFDNPDYDYAFPPPGSPPRRDRALPDNTLGNTNGLVPDYPINYTSRPTPLAAGGWLQRTARALVPQPLATRLGLGLGLGTSRGLFGGGTNNDGVFSNVTAKPSPPRRIQDGDDIYLVPEDAQKDAPPSYNSAQADVVPPYWETTIHAPSSSGSVGELIVDGLQTGSVFSFLWNMLVSISFQFVGFLLTYLLHTTHAAKFGSRAGLGLTLIQYGFSLRVTREEWPAVDDSEVEDPLPSFATAAEAEAYVAAHPNATMSSSSPPPGLYTGAPAYMTSEWLSFLLMTIGWFLLLTSMLGFWRVKRWERSILVSNMPAEQPVREPEFMPMPFVNVGRDIFRQGLGFLPRRAGGTMGMGTELDAMESGRAGSGSGSHRRTESDLLRQAGFI